MGNGYVWYRRRNEDRPREPVLEGLMGFDLVSRRPAPRTSRERPASCRDTPTTPKMRGARLARSIWKDSAFADELEREAADLKRRFNRDFWVADGEYFAWRSTRKATRSTR